MNRMARMRHAACKLAGAEFVLKRLNEEMQGSVPPGGWEGLRDNQIAAIQGGGTLAELQEEAIYWEEERQKALAEFEAAREGKESGRRKG